jgi:hypothetical protein
MALHTYENFNLYTYITCGGAHLESHIYVCLYTYIYSVIRLKNQIDLKQEIF